MKKNHWKIKDVDEKSLLIVQDKFRIPSTIAKIMFLRGITNTQKSKSFFYPEISYLNDPFSLLDMQIGRAHV